MTHDELIVLTAYIYLFLIGFSFIMAGFGSAKTGKNESREKWND